MNFACMNRLRDLINILSDFLSKNKWPAMIMLAIFILIGTLILISHITYTNKLPWYTYGNITWNPCSSLIIYIRDPIYPPDYQNSPNTFEIRQINCKTKEQSLISELPCPSSSIKLLNFGENQETIYFTRISDRKPILYSCRINGKETPKEIKIPCENINNIIQDKDDLIFSEETDAEYNKKFAIKTYNCETNIARTLCTMDVPIDGKYKLIDGDISADRRFFAFAVWKQTNENLEGFTSFWVYDDKLGSIYKTPISSYGTDMDLEISIEKNLAALKTIDISANGIRKPLIHFYNLENKQFYNCFLDEDINLDFEIIWAANSKLFMKTDDKLYLIKQTNNAMTASVIFDKTSIPFIIDEFTPSPSGEKTALIRYAQGTNLKSEVWIANIDGTSPQKLVKPEGRRTFEGNPVYIYLKYCKMVFNDLLKAIT